jgi:hypothetical protein
LEALNETGRIECVTETYSSDGAQCVGRFVYGVIADGAASESYCDLQDGSITLHIAKDGMVELNDANNEGFYLRRETALPSGEVHRFMAFIEKDRPPTHCDKPEEWVYEKEPGKSPETRPIGGA